MGSICLTGCGKSTDDTSKETTAAKQAESKKDDAVSVDQEKADEVADLIDAIYVQERDDNTDKQCSDAKAAWDKLTDAQKELVEGEMRTRITLEEVPGMRLRMMPVIRMKSARMKFL